METIEHIPSGGAFSALIAKVKQHQKPLRILLPDGEALVLSSYDDYKTMHDENAMDETEYLLSNPTNAQVLRQSIADIEVGNVVNHGLIEE